ncbi:hypothetical protein U3516DRAFT_738788 [Neocallimastix sp. 'constans']
MISNLHDFSSGFCVKGRYVFYISNTIRIPLRKPCLRGFTVTPPIVGSAFPRGSRRGASIWKRRRRTGMAVNHIPILLYGEDQSLHKFKVTEGKLKH